MNPEEMSSRLSAAYPGAQIEVTGSDCNLSVVIVSDLFTGSRAVQRQQQIMRLFDDELRSGALHALSIKAHTPEEFAKKESGLVNLGLKG